MSCNWSPLILSHVLLLCLIPLSHVLLSCLFPYLPVSPVLPVVLSNTCHEVKYLSNLPLFHRKSIQLTSASSRPSSAFLLLIKQFTIMHHFWYVWAVTCGFWLSGSQNILFTYMFYLSDYAVNQITDIPVPLLKAGKTLVRDHWWPQYNLSLLALTHTCKRKCNP